MPAADGKKPAVVPPAPRAPTPRLLSQCQHLGRSCQPKPLSWQLRPDQALCVLNAVLGDGWGSG